MSVPGASTIFVEAINDRGEVVGSYTENGDDYGFVYDNGTLTTLSVPGATDTSVTAINDRGEIAGIYDDSSGYHDFVYDNGTYTTLNVPGAVGFTNVAINNRGEVAGAYEDSSGTRQGFLATPEGGEATASGFRELLAVHARLGGMRDFLPDVPGSNGSPHSANAPGMTDQTLAAGARFASFPGLASDQTATHAWLHASSTSSGAG